MLCIDLAAYLPKWEMGVESLMTLALNIEAAKHGIPRDDLLVPVGQRPQQLRDEEELINVRLAGEKRIAGSHLAVETPDGPNIDLFAVLNVADEQLGRPIPSRGHVVSISLAYEAKFESFRKVHRKLIACLSIRGCCFVLHLPGAAIKRAKPKSQSFTTPEFETRTFSGFTSR